MTANPLGSRPVSCAVVATFSALSMTDLARFRAVCQKWIDEIENIWDRLDQADIADELELTGFVNSQKQAVVDREILHQSGFELLRLVGTWCTHLRFLKMDIFLSPRHVLLLRACTTDPIALHLNFNGPWAHSELDGSSLPSLSQWILEEWRNMRIVELVFYAAVPPDFENVLAGITSTCLSLEHLHISVQMDEDDEARCFSMQLRQACATALTKLLQIVSLRSLSLELHFPDLAAVPLSAPGSLARIKLCGTQDHHHVSGFLMRFLPHAMSLRHLQVYVGGAISEIFDVLCGHCEMLETMVFEDCQFEDLSNFPHQRLAETDDDSNLRCLPNLRLLQFGNCPQALTDVIHSEILIARPNLLVEVGGHTTTDMNSVIDRIWSKPVRNIEGLA